ncbi:MAG: hypothetical protein ACI8YQ_001020 [Polaribacter sp.]|jgi:hypothetical protein
MITLFALILSLIFLLLSILHFYWASGGKWGIDAALPTSSTSSGERMLNPGSLGTIFVALALLAMSVLYLLHSNYLSLPISEWIITGSSWFIPSIFLLRSIGDFKYVGLFKKIKNTTFAKADTKIFIPLCLFVSALGFAIVFLR